MAKKKDGSGSNLGLIITLVFFVLSTVILGVTTYMGFSAQDEKDKNVAKANQEKAQAEKDARWGRAKARILRHVISGTQAPGDEAAEVAREWQQIEAGQYDAANSQKDKDDFVSYAKSLPTPWDPNRSTTPSKTLEQLLREKDQQIQAERARAKRAEETAAREKREREDAELEASKTIASLKQAMEAVKTKAIEDRKADLAALAAQRDTLRSEDETHQGVRKKYEDAEKALNKYENMSKRLTVELGEAKKSLRSVTEDRDSKELQLTRALEELGKPRDQLEEAIKDAKVTQLIQQWKKNWRILDLGRQGEMVYVNLGSADRLEPQVTFSVHAVGIDGQLNPTAKGTIEIVRVLGSHLSLARITSRKETANFRKDPIVKGDRLFNPTWDPDRKRHVAIAGLADLGGEGTDNTEDLRRLLARQNVVVDAYIDVKDEKEPKIVGKGITSKTDYLILADNLEDVNHPKESSRDYVAAFRKLERDLKAQALENGVTIIPLRRYLDMIGYQPPKVLRSFDRNGTNYR